MARPKGSRTVLVRITYDDIGRMAGIAGDTARQFAQRGQFDSRDLDSLLTWVNARRARKGLPLVGHPDTKPNRTLSYSDDDSGAVTSTPAPVQTGLLIYNPLTASFRKDF